MKSGVQKGIILLLMAAAIAVAVYFGYINRNASSSEEPVAVGEVQDILLLDYDRHYPPTARETVSNFCRIYKALYGEKASDEQIKEMGGKLLSLYDDELVAHQFDYEGSLMQEVNRKKKDGYTLSTYRVQSASEMVTGTVEGHEVSYVSCTITMRKGSQLFANDYLFVLRREETSGRWKIFGWTVTSDDDS
ncbi:MAG: hypothetical protein K5696_03375 [Lachnospiraceae bacterium]|nr:hypothetical protein [Lachnospiraceae bacterium]